MAGRYKLFMRLLETWPVDKVKKGRDLGYHIRIKVLEAFPLGETSSINADECEKVYLSLKKINDNYYGDKYKRQSKATSTGLTYEECAGVTSTEFLAEVSSGRKFFNFSRKL